MGESNMRATEILNEKELDEYKVIDRLLHSKRLLAAEHLFKRLVHQGMDKDEARHESAQAANVGERELQNYLIDHGLLEPHTVKKSS